MRYLWTKEHFRVSNQYNCIYESFFKVKSIIFAYNIPTQTLYESDAFGEALNRTHKMRDNEPLVC